MNVQCNWIVPAGKPLSDALIWAEDESADIEDVANEENCILLEAPDKGDIGYPSLPACQLLFSCQPPFSISKISILCEARVLEVYGHHGEYLKTLKNELLEELEDMILFRGDVTLEKPLTLCSIKFAGLRNTNKMWLFGVKINRIKLELAMENGNTIPIAAVDERLALTGLVLSEKAEAFKQLVEKCQKSPNSGLLDPSQFFQGALIQRNLIETKSLFQNMQNMLENLTKTTERLTNQANCEDFSNINANIYKESNGNSPLPQNYATNTSTSPMPRESRTATSQTDEEYLGIEGRLKAYVDEQMQNLDNKLWGKIDQRFKEVEAKIMCELEKIESYVKPQGAGNS